MNRVVIANATQGWQETIYYPDTVFAMGTTGITDNVANGDFWSATQYNSSYAYGRDLVFNDADVNGNVSNKYYGYSVRCVRD